MAVKHLAYSTLVLRILTLSLLAASAVYMFLNTFKLAGSKTSWKDLKTYRYVFATAIIGVVYSLIQIPFAVYYACTEKRLVRHSCLPEFDFYADKLVSYLLATGVGAGIAASMELKSIIDDTVALIAFILAAANPNVDLGFDLSQFKSQTHKFLDRGIIATILLALGFACMVVISILSSLNRSRSRNFFPVCDPTVTGDFDSSIDGEESFFDLVFTNPTDENDHDFADFPFLNVFGGFHVNADHSDSSFSFSSPGFQNNNKSKLEKKETNCKINEVQIGLLLKRDNKLRQKLRKEKLLDNDRVLSKRFSKYVVNKYLNLMKSSYVKVSKRNNKKSSLS
ncbi:hypothetical protein L6452_28428 [Arctium lappa]|uniref:Uncharacterized protein n=1 Tax=Arctium lappa TaxID=4217 RepID=A0ACB8ZY94_ARCLA|nr:hypothetical protein L6452_28428 [Arctium lappa]